MDRSSRRGRLYDWLWFLAWGMGSSLWCVTASQQLGATFDEPVYVARGLEGWRSGSHQGLLRLGTMPLPVELDTLPLYLWERWHGIHLDPVNDLEHLLPWARAGTLLFWWLLLAYSRWAGRQLAGPWGGRLAVALLACEPTLLAHASLATTDVAITACLVALVYHFRTGREAGWGRRVALPTFWFAAAVLAKASGLVFGPLCLLAVELERVITQAKGERAKAEGKYLQGENREANDPGDTGGFSLSPFLFRLSPFRRFGCDLVQIMAGGLLLAFVYCGSDWQREPSFVAWAHRLPDGSESRALVWLAERLRIFSNAGEGIVRQIKHNIRGHGTYLLGRVAERSIWYYFPVALTIKLSLPLLILPLALAVLRPRALANWACLAALALLAFSLTCRVQIGVRLVLPLVALAVIGLAAAAARASAREGNGWGALGHLRAYTITFLVTATVTWTAVAAARVWPHGLCYTNELWGGTANGYLFLSDSNYDWGQGLKELATWQRKHPGAPLAVWYFGMDPALEKLPMQVVKLHSLPIGGPADVKASVRGHYLAVGTSLLHGSVSTTLGSSDPQGAESYWRAISFLRGYRPVDRTATFMIYDFTEPRKSKPRAADSEQ